MDFDIVIVDVNVFAWLLGDKMIPIWFLVIGVCVRESVFYIEMR